MERVVIKTEKRTMVYWMNKYAYEQVEKALKEALTKNIIKENETN